ncbi:hypothetical protein [Spirosoma pollinicola]|uniref:hypothetical protein n=1 Tax=Spirosoma pollinicola TaxID=2057025 RepID=UPI001F0B8E29|nr:hypothetical protein [Spirosoma pollinicola]
MLYSVSSSQPMTDQPSPPNLDTSAQNERLSIALQAAQVGTWDLDILNQTVW